jgi:hypothetical protein
MTAPRRSLDIDRTRERLTQLGCSHAAEQLEALLALLTDLRSAHLGWCSGVIS